MKLIYNVKDRPPFGQVLVFALQQLLAILAATIVVPVIINGNVFRDVGFDPGMSQSAALFGAGVGTLVYLLFTKFKSPVFLGSSFAFLGSMAAAFAGAGSVAALGFLGLIVGAVFAGLVYVVIAIAVKFAGVGWISKVMPAVVIGPTVAIIGLSLSGNAIGDLFTGKVTHEVVEKVAYIADDGSAAIKEVTSNVQNANIYLCMICGLVTLAVTIIASVYGKKMMKLIPFIIGIAAGYAVAAIMTVIGNAANIQALQIIDFSAFTRIRWLPDFTFLKAFSGESMAALKANPAFIGTVAVAYIPVAFVVFAEHIADHKNLSSIIGSDLTKDPGLSRTLLGDGVGSMAGSFFGGCPNTTYGESIGCVAITGNASVITIFCTAILAIVASFIGPFVTLLDTIPNCVMGGVCIALYGFIAVSGLKMIQKVDLGDNSNLFVVSVILIAGVGGMTLSFGKITITAVACALILGILVNILVKKGRKEKEPSEIEVNTETTTEDK